MAEYLSDADELDDLRARLAEVEAERDDLRTRLSELEDADPWPHTMDAWRKRARAAEARLAAVLALCDDKRAKGMWGTSAFAELVRAAAKGETNANG